MGRVKLQIKKIENSTNRIEDVIARFVNLPEHERGRLQNQEFLNKALQKLMCESELASHLASPGNIIGNVEELNMEIQHWQILLEDEEKKLRCLEADPHMITTWEEAEFYENTLKESLQRVRLRRQLLEQSEISSFNQPNMQIYLPNENSKDHQGEENIINWMTQRNNESSVQDMLEKSTSNRMLVIRDAVQRVENCMPNATLFTGDSMDDRQVENNMSLEECDHSIGHTSQWQQSYVPTNNLTNSMVQNAYSLGMLASNPIIMTKDETSSQGVQISTNQDEDINIAFSSSNIENGKEEK